MNQLSPSVAILAGGLATRLQSITQETPKALLDIHGTPFIVHQLLLLKRTGIDRIVICAGHLGERIQQSVGNGEQFQIQIQYSFDGPKLLGTGGAILRALPLLSDPFWVLYGDSYLECDYQEILNSFLEKDRLGLMTVFKNEDQFDSSNVQFQNNKIIAYSKTTKTQEMKYIDYGLGVFRKKAFEDFQEGEVFDLARVYERLIQLDQLAGFEVKERFYEIGSLQGLQETRAHLISKKDLH